MIDSSQRLFKLLLERSVFGTLLTVAAVFMATFCLVGYLWVAYEYDQLERESEKFSAEYLSLQKNRLKSEVERIKVYLVNEKKAAEAKLEHELKSRVREMHQIAESIYKNQKNSSSDEEIKSMIYSALSEVLFNEGRGYYFITAVDGIMHLYPPDPTFEGQHHTKVFSEVGQDSIRKMIKLMGSGNEGFVRYQWPLPNESRELLHKYSYVKLFKPYGWILGTGDYLEMFEDQLKVEVFKHIANISYGPKNEGYFFINTYQGDLFVTNGEYFGGNKNIWGTTDEKGTYVVQENARLAKENPEGAFNTYVWKKNEGEYTEKISFVLGVDEWNIFIGAGTYLDSIEDIIAKRKQERAGDLKERVVNSLKVMGITMAIIFFVLLTIMRKLSQNIRVFQSNLEKSVDTWTRLDSELIHFSEFKEVSHSVNKMIDGLNSQAKELKHTALHDHLTNLPNRRHGWNHLENMIAKAARRGSLGALMFIDLDHFKEINDTLGHIAGDELLQKVSKRLSSVLKRGAAVARLGGDEFTVVTDLLSCNGDSEVIAKALLKQFEKPFLIQGLSLHVTASIGVCLFPQDGDTSELILRNADSAMYQAKKDGRNGYCFYNASMTEAAADRFRLSDQIHAALAEDQFELYYQPQVCSISGQILSAEALIRWQHPERGMIPPDQFIPYAEETGLMGAIGLWVLKRACHFMTAVHEQGYPLGKMAINISTQQINDAIVEDAASVITASGCDFSSIEFEITESALMDNPELSQRVLEQLRELGIRLSIDDFGKGYSSLSYLKLFPISKLKIDRDFVRDLEEDENDRSITRAMIALGKSLHLDVIAEGVETLAQLEFLQQEGCEMMQGYLYCRPLPEQEFIALLDRCDENLICNEFAVLGE